MATSSFDSGTIIRQSDQRFGILACCATVSVVLLFLGGWLTVLGLGPWYAELNFPPFQPPSWVFTPVWTVVLSLLAWATWTIVRQGARNGGNSGFALALYGAQCVLNAGWSLVFFTLKRPDAALWVLLVLNVTLMFMIYAYTRISKAAGLALVPYFLWLCLATAINAWIVQNNTPFRRTTPMCRYMMMATIADETTAVVNHCEDQGKRPSSRERSQQAQLNRT